MTLKTLRRDLGRFIQLTDVLAGKNKAKRNKKQNKKKLPKKSEKMAILWSLGREQYFVP